MIPQGEKIDTISIQNYKSIKSCNLDLNGINIFIGANGAGKSNFISVFTLLRNIFERHLRYHVSYSGGPDSLLWFGRKESEELTIDIHFGNNGYGCTLVPTKDNQMMFADEWFSWNMLPSGKRSIGTGHLESAWEEGTGTGIDQYVTSHVLEWVVYHFHDTSDSAKVKQVQALNDNRQLNPDAGNLAPYLYLIKNTHPQIYQRIRRTIQYAAPFFDDFVLLPKPDNPEFIELEWRSVHSTRPFKAADLSDGTLRFICLAVLLLQPLEKIPKTVILDEPELGLHPAALVLLAGMIKSLGKNRQLIISTQSALLLNEFPPENVIVVDYQDGMSVFKRLSDREDLDSWLDEYLLGDLWSMNLIGGRP